MFDALSDRDSLETLVAHILPCPEIIRQILFTVQERGICLEMLSTCRRNVVGSPSRGMPVMVICR
jgi:hypothetical protein